MQLTTARLVFTLSVATNLFPLPRSLSAVVTDLVPR
jgi:hypothetical protein